MKIFTKDTDYAIRALLLLSTDKDNFLSTKKISESLVIPYHFLRGVLGKLIQHGLIESKEGISGGVRIKKNPDEIRLTDLIKIYQGDFELSDCMFRNKICPNRRTCVLREEIKRIEKIVEKEFKKLTIGKLLEKVIG
ncbi:MAG TPA: Rrf2 family transcriptional regulator [Candidatus Atribacteria bacterium]|nr:Rrf2 family transcriptional regulator [Candidatus Atribacteria bacterium]